MESVSAMLWGCGEFWEIRVRAQIGRWRDWYHDHFILLLIFMWFLHMTHFSHGGHVVLYFRCESTDHRLLYYSGHKMLNCNFMFFTQHMITYEKRTGSLTLTCSPGIWRSFMFFYAGVGSDVLRSSTVTVSHSGAGCGCRSRLCGLVLTCSLCRDGTECEYIIGNEQMIWTDTDMNR